jgi:hypothetical protein
LETPILDVSQAPEAQRKLLLRTLSNQEEIGWHLAVRGYLSRYWGLAVRKDRLTEESRDKGLGWTGKAIQQLWEFSDKMWEHRNAALHHSALEASRQIRDSDVNEEITRLYEYKDSLHAEDKWYFDMPLVLRLRKPLRSRRRWLANAKILASKSNLRIHTGQTPLTMFFQHVPNNRIVENNSLGTGIHNTTNYVQTTLQNYLGWRPPDPGRRPQ